MNAQTSSKTSMKLSTLAIALVLMAGCKSKQDVAIDQAKQQAAATGQAQQVVTTDSSGTTTTTVVQPPAPGQTTQQITTTTTKNGTVSASGPQVSAMAPAPSNGAAMTGPSMTADNSAPPPPPAGTPVVSPVNVSVPAGTTLSIRINQHISVKTSRSGDRFSGEVNTPVSVDGRNILIPRGTHVDGVVVDSHRRGHFKGRSILELRLVSMDLNGQTYRLDTRDNIRTKKGKGKRSAAFIGGGTGLGMLVGGVATGGVGLVVGGLVGGGAGTAVAGLTGNRDIEIPAESVMNFKLADDLVVQP
ncbi:hypothetical protein SAMN05421770_101285 [Granulicella rosea]|uniref:Uncharacterized protein n=1 Tax=Granulicella rosea TaxID=474952 RepID=A0A239D490_9BACT|nr:hypothetical protein [Granulicella rosea]SNS27225.1 hypothetical protein SAMN05421770_101285 [Granulicella rosea]